MNSVRRSSSSVRRPSPSPPDNPQVYANLGDTLVRENKVAEAAQVYQKALDLDPENEKIKLKLQALVK